MVSMHSSAFIVAIMMDGKARAMIMVASATKVRLNPKLAEKNGGGHKI